jgi:outer membrane lipoprotein SlyB
VVALTADVALGAAGLTENEVATGDVMSLADARHVYQLSVGARAAKIVFKP